MKNGKSFLNQNRAYLFILGLIVCLFFLPVFTKGWVIIPDLFKFYKPWQSYLQSLPLRYSHLKSDLIDSSFPMFHYIKTLINQGKFPLWNDRADLGKPLINQVPQFILSPVYIFMWFLPEDIGFTVGTIVKVIVAAVGMYYWLKMLKINPIICIGGSVAYVFSGFNLSWLLVQQGTQNLLLPWVFIFTERLLDTTQPRSALKYFILLTSILGLILFTGFFSTAGHLFYLIGIYTISKILFSLHDTTNRSDRIHPKKLIFSGAKVLSALLLSTGLAAIVLLPSVDWINNINVSYRINNNSTWFLPLKTLLQLGLPNYFGNPVLNNWQVSGNWNETSSFVTIICLFSIPLGLIRSYQSRQKIVYNLGIIGLFCFLIIWKITPLLDLVRHLPIFNSSSNTRLIGPLTFVLISIGIYGADGVLTGPIKKWMYVPYIFGLIGLLMLAARKASLLIKQDIFQLKLFDQQVFSTISICLAILVCIFFLITMVFRSKVLVSEKIIPWIVSLLLVFEVGVFSIGHIPFVPRNYYYPRTRLIEFLEKNLEGGRILTFDGIFMISGTQLYYGFDTALTHNLHTSREKEITTLFSKNGWASDTAPWLQSAYTDFGSPVFDIYGVKYVIVDEAFRIADSKWILVGKNIDGTNVYENSAYDSNKYFFSSNVLKISDFQGFANNLTEVASRSLIVCEDEIPLLHTRDSESVSSPTIEVITDSESYNEIKVCTSNSGILAVRDSYWPGWTVQVNGVTTKNVKVNYIYRGVALEKGCSIVTERYNPSSLMFSALISILSLIVFLAFLLIFVLKYFSQKHS